MPDISDLIAQGVKPPQVEDLGTAFARSKATQYTLGNMALQQTRARQEISEGAITLQRAEKQQDEDRAIDNAFAQFTGPGPDGKPKIDRDGLITHLTSTGRGIAAQRVQAQFDANDTAKAKSMEAQTDLQIKGLTLTSQRAGELAKLAQVVKDAPPEGKQDAYQNLHREGLRLGLISPQMQAQFPELYDPSQDPHLDAMILGAQDAKTRSDLQTADLTRNKDRAELDKTRATTAETWRVTAATQAANALSQQDLDGIRARLASQGAPPAALAAIPAMWSQTAMQELARSARTSEQNAQLDQQAANARRAAIPNTPAELAVAATDPTKTPAERAAANDALKRLDQYSQGTKTVINMNAPGMADDMKRAGEQYARTGVMPPLGQGSSGARLQILHEANQWARSQNLTPGDVVMMQAAYQGDRESLKKFQGSRDQIVSFENTAKKNIDLFLGLASKIPDSGSPWINTPMRLLTDKMIGSENMAAVNAARAVATNEIAKVTSGGSMTGVLTDSAREEVKEYNPQNATFAQTLAVVKVLKQDMANRHQSMDDSLTDIKSRIGGGGTGGAAPAATHRYNLQTGQIEVIK